MGVRWVQRQGIQSLKEILVGPIWQTNEFSTQREPSNRCVKSVDYSATIVIGGRGENFSRLEDHTEPIMHVVKLLHIFV